MKRDDVLARRLDDHRASVREFVERAQAVDATRWLTPRAEGKWTPAQESKHLILAYDAILRDMAGGTPMRLKGTPWKRRLWRAFGLTMILWRKRIPAAVNAPREARPEWESASAAELLPQLARRADDFDATISRLWRSDPGRRLTHPYFGALTLDQVLQFVAVHTRHHAAFLAARPQGGKMT